MYELKRTPPPPMSSHEEDRRRRSSQSDLPEAPSRPLSVHCHLLFSCYQHSDLMSPLWTFLVAHALSGLLEAPPRAPSVHCHLLLSAHRSHEPTLDVGSSRCRVRSARSTSEGALSALPPPIASTATSCCQHSDLVSPLWQCHSVLVALLLRHITLSLSLLQTVAELRAPDALQSP
jgi:hypothetical protein